MWKNIVVVKQNILKANICITVYWDSVDQCKSHFHFPLPDLFSFLSYFHSYNKRFISPQIYTFIIMPGCISGVVSPVMLLIRHIKYHLPSVLPTPLHSLAIAAVAWTGSGLYNWSKLPFLFPKGHQQKDHLHAWELKAGIPLLINVIVVLSPAGMECFSHKWTKIPQSNFLLNHTPAASFNSIILLPQALWPWIVGHLRWTLSCRQRGTDLSLFVH